MSLPSRLEEEEEEVGERGYRPEAKYIEVDIVPVDFLVCES